MQRKTPRGIWALRTVSIAVTLVVLIVIGTVVYSAYEDYNGLRQELSGGSHPVAVTITPQGSSAEMTLTIMVPNGGLYSLNLTAACDSAPSGVTCHPAQTVIRPGETGTLNFTMTVADAQQFTQPGGQSVNGTVTIALEPFVSLSLGVDFGSMISGGGG